MLQCEYITPYDESICYNMSHSKRGYALVFLFDWPSDFVEVDQRCLPLAKERDKHKLVQTLIHLEFDPAMIQICENFTVQEIQDQLQKVSREDHTKNDCLLVVISTHGSKKVSDHCYPTCQKGCRQPCERKEILYVRKDNHHATELDVEMMWSPFTADKSPTLRGKPKLFFIEACRGTDADPGVDAHISNVDMDSVDSIGAPSTKMSSDIDFLIVRSCTSGTVSFSSRIEGSFFLQTLCDYLLKEGRINDLGSILLKVTNEIDGVESFDPKQPTYHQMKQTIETVGRLRKKVMFIPRSLKIY